MIVTIDGPAGTGKSTVAQRVAAALKLPFFDTGAMYRAVAYEILKHKIALSDENGIRQLLRDFSFEIRGSGDQKQYFSNGHNVTREIRSQAVNHIVSPVSALVPVREAIWEIQRKFAKQQGGVFEGRDMGSVVFPKAQVKIFLTARPEERAKRRLNEILQKRPDEAATLDVEQVKADLQRRDAYDSSRQLAPLSCPDDAYVVDTSDLSIDEVVTRILEYSRKKNLRPVWMHLKGVKWLYRCVIFLTWVAAKLFYRHKVYGLEHFYPRGAIIAANHVSFLDPPLLAISWPEEVHFLARETLFRNRLFGRFIGAINAHPVSGDASDVAVFKMICSLIEEGKKVILFPEGTRSLTGEMAEAKPGVGMLVARTRSALIPAYLKGPYEIWGRDRKFPKLFGKTICVFGSPIRWDSFAHLEKREAQEAIAKQFSLSVAALKAWLEAGAKGIPP